MKTVREIFSKAFGDVPDGATCHIGFASSGQLIIRAVVSTHKDWMPRLWFENEWTYASHPSNLCGPDISDRPASAFRGFFGKEYDDALDAQGETK